MYIKQKHKKIVSKTYTHSLFRSTLEVLYFFYGLDPMKKDLNLKFSIFTLDSDVRFKVNNMYHRHFSPDIFYQTKI